jgi:hypothetical protein
MMALVGAQLCLETALADSRVVNCAVLPLNQSIDESCRT